MPFVLFFGGGLLEGLRKKYKIGLRGGHPKVLIENARRQGLIVSEMGKEELNQWKKRVEKLGRDDHQLAKDVAKVALFGSGARNIPIQVTKGLKFGHSESVVLVFAFSAGSIFRAKKIILGAMIFPNTSQDKEDAFQYFRNLVSEAEVYPISEENWKLSEKTRRRLASKTPNIEGLEENLWKKILQ